MSSHNLSKNKKITQPTKASKSNDKVQVRFKILNPRIKLKANQKQQNKQVLNYNLTIKSPYKLTYCLVLSPTIRKSI